MIEGVNILGAGADTTSIAILAVMGQLLLHPEAYSRLQDEVDNAYLVLDGGISGDIDFKEAERLPFLTAVIKESMRLHPSITYQLPRVVPEGGVRLESFYIPSGITCGISPAAMNRSKELFGQDADDWNPER